MSGPLRTQDAHLRWLLPRPADLVAMLEGSSEGLVAGLARELAAGQAGRASSSVAARFREQLRDLIARLDRCACECLVGQAPAGEQCNAPSALGAP